MAEERRFGSLIVLLSASSFFAILRSVAERCGAEPCSGCNLGAAVGDAVLW